MAKVSGVYQITNQVDGKIYIGSSVNIQERWYTHIWALKKNRHYSVLLQRAWNKHGEQNFLFEIKLIARPEDLPFYERLLIDFYKPHDPAVGYNTSLDTVSFMLGRRHSEATRAKMAIAAAGRKTSEETKQKLSVVFKGRPISEEQRQKISAAKKGKAYLTEAAVAASVKARTGRKQSESHIAKRVAKITGAKRSAETRLRLSAAHKGKPLSEEHRKKLSESHKGQKLTEEQKKKISASLSGRTLSEEHKRNLSKARAKVGLAQTQDLTDLSSCSV